MKNALDIENIHGGTKEPDMVPPENAVLEELERILAARAFRSAQSQSRFLRYVVEETLAGREHQIKEYMIGTEALGRGTEFDPRLDPIVRTQARKLRARLDTYYETEGEANPVRIEFRKGSYTPSFRWTTPVETETPSPEIPAAPDPEAVGQLSPNIVADKVVQDSSPELPAGMFSQHVSSHKQLGIRIGALVFVGLLAGISYLLGTGWRPGGYGMEAPSVAVIPFVNLSENNADEFWSDGLTDELIDSLKQIPGLQVSARTSAFRYKGKSNDIRAISRELHVRTLLIGSVRKSGDRLRITAQLDSATDGYRLWTGSFDRDVADARTIQWEISRAVANVLARTSLRDGGREFARAFPNRALPSPGAYESYLKGLYFWNKLSTEGLNTAIQYFQQAIAEDPSFARAYAALAHCYVIAPQVSTAPPPSVLAMIRSTAGRALELDGRLGEAHFDLAVIAEYEFDWATAEAEFRKGLELSPGSAVGHLWYAKFLALVGRKDEVLVQRKIAIEMDPVSPYATQALAGYYSVVGRYDEAVAQFQSALALNPDFGLAHQGLGMAYLLQGKNDQAIEELQLANKWMSGPRRMALLGWAYARCGRASEARKILQDFLQNYDRGPFPAIAIAQVYIGLGDKDQAFHWLNKAIDQKDLDVTLKWDSPFEPLRSDPRFLLLLQRMKLA